MIRYNWNFHAGWFLLAVLGHIITLAAFSKTWCFLVAGFGHDVPLKYGFKISYIMNLGRYIPGKIWPIFGMVHYARQIKMTEEAAVSSWVLAQLFALPSAFLAGLTGLLLYPRLLSLAPGELQQILLIFLAAGAFTVSAALITWPDHSFTIVNKLLRKFGRPELRFHLTSKMAAKVYLGYVMCWILYGISFWLFLKSILPDPIIGVPEAATAFILAYQLGYVALFAPGGIGVRELVLTGALSPYVGAVAGGVAVAARFWNLIVEIAAALIAVVIKINIQELTDDKKETERSGN